MSSYGARLKAGCFALLLTAGILSTTIYLAASQSDMSVSQLFDRGYADLTGATKLKGIEDRGSIDLGSLQDSSLGVAEERWPDASITILTAENVRPNGHADLTLGNGGTVFLSFGSPASLQSGELPVGTTGSDEAECLDVLIESNMARTTSRTSASCRKALEAKGLPKAPICSVEQIWKRAIEAGAPAENAVAEMTYNPIVDDAWHFKVAEFRLSLADDCGLTNEGKSKSDAKEEPAARTPKAESDLTVDTQVVEHRGGLDKRLFERVVSRHAAAVKKCLPDDPRTLRFELHVAPDGEVEDATFNAGDAASKKCVRSALDRMKFPREGEPTSAEVELTW